MGQQREREWKVKTYLSGTTTRERLNKSHFSEDKRSKHGMCLASILSPILARIRNQAPENSTIATKTKEE